MLTASGVAPAASQSTSVPTFGGNAQHTANYPNAAQNLNRVHWSTTINLYNSGTLAHYGAPLVSAANNVFVPVSTANGGFQVSAFNGSSGQALYTLTTDYILPAYNWIPVYQPVLATNGSNTRLYYAGAGGTIYYINNPDSSPPGAAVQLAFYGLANYTANMSAFSSSVFIDTPITADSHGTVFFGFRVQGTAPAPLNTTQSGFARIDASGNGSYVLVGNAAADSNIGRDSHNSAPALSNDQSTLYVVAKSTNTDYYGYLLGLDSTQLTTKYKVFLTDPRNGSPAGILDDGTASPLVGPDNDVYFGTQSNPDNGSRGFMLHFSSDLTIEKTPGAFGWDNTPGVVPASMVPSYQGTSSYLIFSKYNNYANVGDGDGVNKVALLDPNATQIDPHPSANGLVEMREVLTMIGVTPDPEHVSSTFPNAVREWCINTPAVNPATKSIYFTSEDGHVYRWDLTVNAFTQAVPLGPGVGEPYVPTIIGPDGAVYTLNGGTLFTIGNLSGVSVSIASSIPDARKVVAGQSLTFTATMANTGASGLTPTGTVTFQDQTFSGTTPVTTPLGTPSLNNGQASVTLSTLAAGSHFITATYSGDSNFGSGSMTLVQTIHAGASTTALSSSPNPSTPGQAVTFTATVTGGTSGTPTGMVTFSENTNILAQVPLSAGAASFGTSSLGAGNNAITAGYYSDSIFAASTGSAIQQVSLQPQPIAVSVSPNNASGFGPNIFKALYTDPNGASDLQVVYMDFAASAGATHSCFVAYVQATNALYLLNDTNIGIIGPVTPGQNGTASSNQCTLSGNGGAVTRSGNNLTVPLSITFAAGFAGPKNIYGLAQNYSGANGGWQTLGTWTPGSAAALGAVSITPNSGSAVTQLFSALFTDPNGAIDLQVVYLDFGTSILAANSCIVAYVQASNALYLFNDTNSGVLGPITEGASATLSNSQCTISGNGEAVTPSGNNLTVPVTITFLNGFSGSKNIYGLAQGYSGANGGWQLLGTWTPTAAAPLSAVSVSPMNGGGFGPQTFSALYTDPNGSSDLQVVYLTIGNSGGAAQHSCFVAYVQASGTLYLFSDSNGVLGPISAGSNNILSNSQCTLSGAGGTGTGAGNNLTVPFSITFANGFAGSKNVYGLAQSYSGTQSAWLNLGTWNP